MVARPALEFESRAHRRLVRRGTRYRAWKLVGPKMEYGTLAKGCPAHDHVARRRFCDWCALNVFLVLQRVTPHIVHTVFGKLQIVSAAFMAHSHGTNDAQKTMGIITLALFTGTKAGSFEHLPPWLQFLHTPAFGNVPVWVKVLCAATMAAGTAAGGWRIIRTLGHKMVKLQPVHGFAAETTAAIIIQSASAYGIPLSTTHVISTSIMGVGAAKRFSGVKWSVVERIVWTWIFTLPATGLLGFLLARAAQMF